MRTCAADPNGCLDWSGWSDCADGFCADAQSCGSCDDGCGPAGATDCSAGRIRTCVADAHGCLTWGDWSDCADGFCADATTCGFCDDGCGPAGASECADGRERTCAADPNGCLDWSGWSDCADGFCADARSCGTCDDGCGPVGASECAGGRMRSCVADQNGCLDWGDWSDCAEGFCADGATCGSCDVCEPIEHCGGVLVGDARYVTIGQALAAAPDEATVQVCPGTYHETLQLERPVHLVGVAGSEQTIVDAQRAQENVVTVGDPDDVDERHFSISGLTIQGGLNDGLTAAEPNLHLTLTDCRLRGNDARGVRLAGRLYEGRLQASLTDVVIEGNGFEEQGISGMTLVHADVVGLRVSLRGNVGAAAGGLACSGNSDIVLTDSRIAGNSKLGAYELPGAAGGIDLGHPGCRFEGVNVDLGFGDEDNQYADVVVEPEQYFYTSIYAHFAAGEHLVCDTASGRCEQLQPPPVAAGPTADHCAGADPVDVNGLATYATIAAALRRAPPGSWVSVCAGSYTEDLHIGRPAHLIGVAGSAATSIQGSGAASTPVIWLEGDTYAGQEVPPIAVHLEGLSISGGSRGGVAGGDRVALELIECLLTGNDRGGLRLVAGLGDEHSAALLEDVAVTDNSDGGIFLQSSDLTGQQVVVTGNSYPYGDGGGILMINERPTLELSDSLIADNSAHGGGGIAIFGMSIEASVTLTDCALLRNTATDGGGGAILIEENADAPTISTSNTDFGQAADDNSPDDIFFDSYYDQYDALYDAFGAGENLYCHEWGDSFVCEGG